MSGLTDDALVERLRTEASLLASAGPELDLDRVRRGGRRRRRRRDAQRLGLALVVAAALSIGYLAAPWPQGGQRPAVGVTAAEVTAAIREAAQEAGVPVALSARASAVRDARDGSLQRWTMAWDEAGTKPLTDITVELSPPGVPRRWRASGACTPDARAPGRCTEERLQDGTRIVSGEDLHGMQMDDDGGSVQMWMPKAEVVYSDGTTVVARANIAPGLDSWVPTGDQLVSYPGTGHAERLRQLARDPELAALARTGR